MSQIEEPFGVIDVMQLESNYWSQIKKVRENAETKPATQKSPPVQTTTNLSPKKSETTAAAAASLSTPLSSDALTPPALTSKAETEYTST